MCHHCFEGGTASQVCWLRKTQVLPLQAFSCELPVLENPFVIETACLTSKLNISLDERFIICPALAMEPLGFPAVLSADLHQELKGT